MKNPYNFISLSTNLMYLVCDIHERHAIFFLVATTTVTCRKEVIKLQWGWTPFYMY